MGLLAFTSKTVCQILGRGLWRPNVRRGLNNGEKSQSDPRKRGCKSYRVSPSVRSDPAVKNLSERKRHREITTAGSPLANQEHPGGTQIRHAENPPCPQAEWTVSASLRKGKIRKRDHRSDSADREPIHGSG